MVEEELMAKEIKLGGKMKKNWEGLDLEDKKFVLMLPLLIEGAVSRYSIFNKGKYMLIQHKNKILVGHVGSRD